MSSAAPVAREEPRLTIGAVCRALQDDFPDISISKIRYLEDQGLLAPRRTQGGYRLFGEDDVDRLRTILRLQRDEFLPLRVIRQELASPTTAGADRKRRRPLTLGERDEQIDLDELCRRAGVTAELVRELESFGLLEPRADQGTKTFAETDAEVAATCAALARYGLSARHLRSFRSAADREAALLGQLAAPGLRSRNLERRQRALDELQAVGELCQRLSASLFWRAVRRLAA